MIARDGEAQQPHELPSVASVEPGARRDQQQLLRLPRPAERPEDGQCGQQEEEETDGLKGHSGAVAALRTHRVSAPARRRYGRGAARRTLPLSHPAGADVGHCLAKARTSRDPDVRRARACPPSSSESRNIDPRHARQDHHAATTHDDRTRGEQTEAAEPRAPKARRAPACAAPYVVRAPPACLSTASDRRSGGIAWGGPRPALGASLRPRPS